MTQASDTDLSQRCAQLENEVAKLTKINRVLMNRVERSMDMQGSAFSLFQAATALESKVGERTEALERSNEQLRVSMEAADAANRAKSRFLAMMSHEIRTPMNGVLGMAELLQSTTLSRRQRSLLDTIVNSGQSLLSLINDILDLSRIEAGRMELAYSDASPRDCLEGVFDMLAERARAKNLELVADIDDAVPEIIHSDVLRLRQVLVNLIGNAVKFTDRGAIVVRVEVESVGSVLCLRFSVRDSGIGVAADKLARIFDPFTQADASTTRQHGGTGLGLAICRRLVELMGGQISVQSELDVGSTFTFTISAEPQFIAASKKIGGGKLQGKRIALAVDNSDLARVIEHRCQREGARISTLDFSASTNNTVKDCDVLIVDERSYRANVTGATLNYSVLILSDRLEREEIEASPNLQVERLLKPVKDRDLVKALLRLCASPLETCALPTLRPDAPRVLNANVLLVEDNDINREVATEMLSGFGCSVTCAVNGKEAVEQWRQTRFDIILMDFQMPIMDGITATEIIRAEEIERAMTPTPIVALTANAFEEDRSRAMQAGCNAFLAKPISRAPFFAILDRLLAGAPDNKQASKISMSEVSATMLSGDDEPIDMRMIDEIKALGQQDLLPRLIGMYIEESSKKIEAIKHACATQDAQALFVAAHTLKSASASLGGRAMAAVCRELEIGGKQGRVPATTAIIDELIVQRVRLCEALQHLCTEQAA